MLQLMVNAHPRVAISGELHFYDSVRAALPPGRLDASQLDVICEAIGSNAYTRLIADLDLVIESLRRSLEARPTFDVHSVYRALIEGVAAVGGSARGGEKTPINVRYLPEITTAFPHAQIIHIVRDPRGVVASRLKVRWSTDDVLLNTIKWRSHVLAGRRAGAVLGPAQYLEIRYEDLVRDTEGTLRSVCRFLGEEFAPEMLESHRSAEANVELGAEPWKGNVAQPVQSSSLEGWRRTLSPPQVRLVEMTAAPLLSEFGYVRSGLGRARQLLPALMRELRAAWGSREVLRGDPDQPPRQPPSDRSALLVVASLFGRIPRVVVEEGGPGRPK